MLLEARDILAGSATLNWHADRRILDWDGITVSGSPRRVTKLELNERQLTGSIPPQLSALASLERLRLDNNQLSGSIPPRLAALANLEWLYLADNRLSGSIPPELGTLTNLEGLVLHTNQLSGPIPPELGALASLRALGLNNNQLSGPIPPQLGALYHLELLGLDNNQLSGPIPPALGGLASLRGLALGGNRLSGSIPSELGTLTNLEGLFLHANHLSGPIPPELGNLTKLEKLYLSGGNVLTGCLPPALRGVAGNDFDKLGLPLCEVMVTPIPALATIRRQVMEAVQAAREAASSTPAPTRTPAATPTPPLIARLANSVEHGDVTHLYQRLIEKVFMRAELPVPDVLIYNRHHPHCRLTVGSRSKSVKAWASLVGVEVCLWHPSTLDPRSELFWHELAHIHMDQMSCLRHKDGSGEWEQCVHGKDHFQLTIKLWANAHKVLSEEVS